MSLSVPLCHRLLSVGRDPDDDRKDIVTGPTCIGSRCSAFVPNPTNLREGTCGLSIGGRLWPDPATPELPLKRPAR